MSNSNKKRVSRPIKREADESVDVDGVDQAQEELKHSRRSPYKQSSRAKRDEDEDESGDEDYDEEDEEMADFIVNEDEEEPEQSYRQERRRRRKKRNTNYRLDDEDREVIKENTGIELQKKNRLKRNAEKRDSDDGGVTQSAAADDKALVKKEIEIRERQAASSSTKIDTTAKRRNDYKAELRQEYYEDLMADRRNENADKLKQAQGIFGDDDDELELPQAGVTMDGAPDDVPIEVMFNADEIDDPFSTQADKQIEATDICERLHVRLKNRMRPSESEINAEAEWMFDLLTTYSSLKVDPVNGSVTHQYKYNNLTRQKDGKAKIIKVLQMLRCKLLDVPLIAHYRKFEYADELDEESIWIIYNLDQEYGKFQRQKKQIQDFLDKVVQINPTMKVYSEELRYSKKKSELNNFNSLISFLSSYYQDKLDQEANGEKGGAQTQRKKQPLKRDEIQIARQGRIEQFAAHFSLSWAQFLENMEMKKMTHVPPRPTEKPKELAQRFINDQYPTENLVHQGVCKFAAIELSAQPLIRSSMKNNIKEHATVTTMLTEQGKKDLDLFHPSYRVKCVKQLPLSELMNKSDLYLDILQCEKAGLVTVNFTIDPVKQNNFKNWLMSLYMQDPEGSTDQWNILRSEIIQLLVEKLLMKELIAELRDEIKEQAESFVIAKCKETYRRLLMTGPFTTKDSQNDGFQEKEPRRQGWRQDNEIVKDRERNIVMGAIMHQIDANNYVVTVAIVDKYGELVQTRDFMRLLPPRKRNNMAGRGGEDQPMDGRPLPKTDEETQHEKDKKKLIELLEEYSVDLITVAANCLDARNLKRCLESIAGELKNKIVTEEEENRGKKGQAEPAVRKEVLTIWGSTEVPKLFSMSHNSQRMHKNIQQMYKQAISLARFEQDPLCELLNLWSPITAENQALALNLDPMQKWVNQARLADGLEEVNIQVVNEIGIDINLVCEHDHMHSMLQFISGFGPRKAKKFIAKMKGLGKKLTTRSDIIKSELLGQEVYMSATAFLKIRVPDEDLSSTSSSNFFILDQTRIHHESYKLAIKIARDTSQGENMIDENDKAGQMHQLREIMADPEKLKSLDLQIYQSELLSNNQQHFAKIIYMIVKELGDPFGDPREYRSHKSPNMSPERLFYLLIEESKRSFKRGLIVTATVTKVFDSKAICRLDNGLSAIIQSSAILDENSGQNMKDILDFGKIVQGRIEKIVFEEENKFEVQLACKTNLLSSHEAYMNDLATSLGIEPNQIDPADLRNHNFSTDQRPKQTGRFIPRRIAHEKFKNISSRRAISELNLLETGDFFFRPSTRSEDRITLTWKFWKNHYVHIDINESNKQPGAAIGSTLVISQDYYFESLREIVERYIIPCNRLVREVVGHQKFSDAKTFEDLEARLKEEKKDEPARIPYRFAILPTYPQYVVLCYVPKEKVLKEFIKVRPKGFYFHEVNHVPFQVLINWFKTNWRTLEYQKHLKRQRSPRVQARPAPVEASQVKGDNQASQYQQQSWGGDTAMKQERAGRSPGRRDDQPRWGGQSVKQEGYGGSSSMQQDSWGAGGAGNDDNRGRGGGGGSRACYKCNEEGHMARECPNGDAGGERRGGGNGNCFKCDQPGHMARDCTNADQRPPRRPMECFKCQQEGHMARDCPNPDADGGRGRGRGGGSRACYKCQKEGHMAKDCPTADAGGDSYKRPRRDDDGGYSRADAGAGNASWGNNAQPASSQGGNDNWGSGAAAQGGDWNAGAGAGGGWDNNQ